MLEVGPFAEADINEAFVWYEDRSPSLGLAFLRAVDECFDSISFHPAAYPVVHRQIRRVLVRRFPYAVFYWVEGDRLTILACVHMRQHPRRWRSRA